MKANHAPFSLFKKKVGGKLFWYARYWNPEQRRYSQSRALHIEVGGKRERRDEAATAAFALMDNLKSGADGPLLQFLSNFWKEDSPYFREAEKVLKKPLSKYYIKSNCGIINNHIRTYPPFKNMAVSELSRKALREFVLWEAERGVSGHRINKALQTIRVPIRDAVSNDELDSDPFVKGLIARETHTERGVLSIDEAVKLINLPVEHELRSLAVSLALFAGLRKGEIRALKWENVKADSIVIDSNFQDDDGIKPPKCGSFRTVPITAPLSGIISKCRKESGLIFTGKDGTPLSQGFFRNAKIEELKRIGISLSEQKKRNIPFHALRHSFVSLSRLAGVTDFEIQALAGHKSSSMMDRYSHPSQVVDVCRCANTINSVFLQKKA